jgi:predicted component of type VI protein secretion system
MAKLVIQNQGMTGRTHELAVERTTVGRVEDNTFQITDPSVSSHHCEVLLRGTEVVLRDLNSTNGTFINEARITESVLKPGQTLRLGQVELKLETEDKPGAPAPAPAAPAAPAQPGAPAAPATAATTPAAPPAPAAPKRTADATMVMPRGVTLSELESSGTPPPEATTNMFSKKRNKVGQYFWIGAGVVLFVIIVLILFVLKQAGRH